MKITLGTAAIFAALMTSPSLAVECNDAELQQSVLNIAKKNVKLEFLGVNFTDNYTSEAKLNSIITLGRMEAGVGCQAILEVNYTAIPDKFAPDSKILAESPTAQRTFKTIYQANDTADGSVYVEVKSFQRAN